jgi:hypothetical protein
MNIIFGICYTFIILGWANHFYCGDYLKGGFQSLKDPRFMGTFCSNHHFYKEIPPKKVAYVF